jgi:hypothetical protein
MLSVRFIYTYIYFNILISLYLRIKQIQEKIVNILLLLHLQNWEKLCIINCI